MLRLKKLRRLYRLQVGAFPLLRRIYGPTNLIDSVTKSAMTNTGSVDLIEQRRNTILSTKIFVSDRYARSLREVVTR